MITGFKIGIRYDFNIYDFHIMKDVQSRVAELHKIIKKFSIFATFTYLGSFL